MEPELVAPATPDTPVEVIDDSIAAHEAAFGPTRPPVEETPAEPTRHRAQSQKATPADVPRIAELTRKLRDAERERDDWKTKASSTPVPPAAPAIAETKTATTERTATSDKPLWATFEGQIGDKYQTWGEAQDAYVDARDDWKDAQAKVAQQSEAASQAQQSVLQGYTAKAQEFAKATPDFFDKMKDAAPILDHIPDLLFQSIVRHDNGPEIAYYLVNNPAELDRLAFDTDGRTVTDSSVALLQRRLSHYRTPAAPTASAAVVTPPKLAPRPPNAVRTGPLKTGDALPGDDSSLAEHERAYGPKKTR